MPRTGVRAVRGLRRGDPLGADVPVGYVVAAECEARTVRLLLAGAAPGARRHEICSSDERTPQERRRR